MTTEDNTSPAKPDFKVYSEIYDIGAQLVSTVFSSWVDLTHLHVKQIAEMTASYGWDMDSQAKVFQKMISVLTTLPSGTDALSTVKTSSEATVAATSTTGASAPAAKGRQGRSSVESVA